MDLAPNKTFLDFPIVIASIGRDRENGKIRKPGHINFCPDKIYSELYIFYIVKFYAFEKELRAAN